MRSFDTRWRKALRDLGWARSAWVWLALALGQATAGVLLLTWAWVEQATEQGYRASLPVSATLRLPSVQAFEPARLESWLRAHPEVAAWRLRRQAGAQLQGAGRARAALLTAYDDAQRRTIGRLQPDGGAWPPPDGALLIERSSMGFADLRQDDELTLRIGEREHRLPLRGVLRDVSLAPGWMENLVYLQASEATLRGLGLPPGFNELQIRLRDAGASRVAVIAVVETLRAELAAQGLKLQGVEVPEPGEHAHAAQMNSLLLTQAAFALLTLAASGFLAYNLFAARLAAQTRELGVLKALGAPTRDLLAMGFGQAALLGLSACVLALPCVLWGARTYTAFKLEMLNFPPPSGSPPLPALLAWLAVGLGLPLLAAWGPLRRAAREPVRVQLDAVHALAELPAGEPSQARGPALILVLAARQLRRRRLRSSLTLIALTLAVAGQLSAGQLRRAVQQSVDSGFAMQDYQLLLRLSRPGAAAVLEAVAGAQPGVAAVEAWRGERGHFGEEPEALPVIGLPVATRRIKPQLAEGRWLAGPGELVLSRALTQHHPEWRPGQRLRLRLDGGERELLLVGVAEAGPMKMSWVRREDLPGPATLLAVALRDAREPLALAETGQALRAALEAVDHPVAGSQSLLESRRVLEDHLLMVVNFLAVMGWVLLAVAGMGLAATLGQGVLERRREIGVLRTLGLRGRSIAALLAAEAGLLLLAALALALPLAAPLGAALEWAFGHIFAALPWVLWPQAAQLGQTAGVLVAVGLLALALPLLRALRVPALEALRAEGG